ncbi:hypothetical protein SH203_01680 [Brevundimonas sp. SH203]|uniref:hypothetical protein n=1 Tax=Brevundimonas sp. SH203 TaxID=345167 RepID=UPI0009CFE2FC|nr:hypothetical protein [Brevundimonas sp. SH203]GAW41276.1 hypothetical protein SH203_01680 [Brevundimonas sp. SH203]
MKKLTPFAVLAIFGFIGLLTHKFGLWFAFGIVAALAVGGVQHRRDAAKTPPADTPRTGD